MARTRRRFTLQVAGDAALAARLAERAVERSRDFGTGAFRRRQDREEDPDGNSIAVAHRRLAIAHKREDQTSPDRERPLTAPARRPPLIWAGLTVPLALLALGVGGLEREVSST